MTRSELRRTMYRGAMTTLTLLLAAVVTTPAAAQTPAAEPEGAPVPEALRVAVAGAFSPAELSPSVSGVAFTAVPAVLAAAATTAGGTRIPATPAGMPAGIEPLSEYVGQTSCEPTNKPGAVALGQLLKAAYPNTSYGVARACQVYMASEHYDGRAVDWMNSVRDPQQRAQATALINWLLAKDSAGRAYANARRLGLMYMIWDNKIWESYRANAGWQPYNNCAARPKPAEDSACHRNHIHFSLSWAGAMKRTSFWTKRVAVADFGPCRPVDLNFAEPYSKPNPKACTRYPKRTAPAGASATLVSLTKFSGAYLRPGSTGPAVTALQTGLGVDPAGHFGDRTTATVVAFKRARGLGTSPVVDGSTWRKVLPYVASRQPKPTPAPAKPLPAKPKPAKPKPKPASAKPKNALTPYRNSVLRYNSRGAAVSALQRALKVRPVSGWFGPVTRDAVKKFQRARKLPVTGVVDARTWRALGA